MTVYASRSDAFRYLSPPEGWEQASGCWVLGCGREAGPAHGMCWGHLQRVYRGQPVFVYLARSRGKLVRATTFEPRSWSRRDRRMARIRLELETNWTPEPNTGCWLWLGSYFTGPCGYARLGCGSDPWGGTAHRATLYFAGVALEHSRLRHTRHLCRQPACVNPSHIVYGTAAENMADREMHRRLGVLRARPSRLSEAA